MTDEQEHEATPAQLPVLPSAVRSAALAELDRSAEFLRRLSLSEWDRPSAARDWSVGDVVAHLALAMSLYDRLLGAAVGGHTGGRAWKAMSDLSKRVMPAAGPALNSLNRMVPHVMGSALAPEVVQGQFLANVRGLRGRVERIDSPDFTRTVHYLGSPWPLSFFLGQMVDELAMHIWDIASVLDPAAHLSEDARSVIPWFFWSGTSMMLRMPPASAGSLQALLTDPPAEMWWQVAGDERQGVGRRESPDATITASSGVFSLALAGRYVVDDALTAGVLAIEGNERLARDFLGAWRIL